MKPDYKNWVPKGALIGMTAGTVIAGILFLVFGLTSFLSGKTKIVTEVILAVVFLIILAMTILYFRLYQAFSYDGKKRIAARIINSLSDYIILPHNGKGLDVGCGSGALTIACAKKNRHASMTGVDRWGKEYSSFNKNLCQVNAIAEGVDKITSFVQGDAHKLDFPDEYFDAVTSNYCYHNIPGRNRQKYILETLRVLKKGGTFAIHDLFTKNKYGDMNVLIEKLKDMGYEKVELINTMDGLFLNEKEAASVMLQGSFLLTGKK